MHTRAFSHLHGGTFILRLLAAFCLLTTLAACGPTNTLVDEAGTVSSGSYWSRGVKLSNSGPISINLTVVDGSVACFLVDSDSASGMTAGRFRYVQELSAPSGTKHFVQTANVPAGTYSFVVMTLDYDSLVSQSANASFAVTIKGGMGSSVTSGIAPAMVRQSPPSQAPAPQTPPPLVRQTPSPGYIPPPPLKLTFSSLDQGIEWLGRGQPQERQAALTYVAQQNVTEGNRKAVFDAVMPMSHDQTYQHDALPILMKWASSEDLPALRGILESMIGGDPARLDTHVAADALTLAKYLLEAQDAESVAPAIRLMHAASAHDGARQAIAAFGGRAEPTLLDTIARNPNALDTKDLLGLLADVGTDKSIQPLQDLMASKNEATSGAAGQAIAKLAGRLNLTPDQYLYNLFNHYVVEGPAGFVPDPTVAASNTKRWTRQTPGRAVKSTYTVQVTHVANDFQLQAPPNGNTLQAGGALAFHSMNAPPSPQFTVAARMTALDGEYLIDIIAAVDTADLTAQTNITNAVKKIHPK